MRNYPDNLKEYHHLSIETFDYILERIRNDIIIQSNFRVACVSLINFKFYLLLTTRQIWNARLETNMFDQSSNRIVSGVLENRQIRSLFLIVDIYIGRRRIGSNRMERNTDLLLVTHYISWSISRAFKWNGYLTKSKKIKVRRHVYTRSDNTAKLTNLSC